MSKSYVTGFGRIGEQRELKFALEAYWAGKSDFASVENVAKELRKRHWQYQKDAGIEKINFQAALPHLVLSQLDLLGLVARSYILACAVEIKAQLLWR